MVSLRSTFLQRLFGRFVEHVDPLDPGDGSSQPVALPDLRVPSRREIEALVRTDVRNLELYVRALTHRSVLRGETDSHLVSNERLEFLGDSVLGFVIAEYLHDQFPDEDEGFLTRLRAKIVNGQALARVATSINLGSAILVSENMEQAQGRRNPTILADALEAIIGALYLDKGLPAARTFIERVMLADVDLADLAARHDNYKSALLEFAQARAWPQPLYRLAREEGPSHDRIFTVEVVLNNRIYGMGTAASKKKAEQIAAGEALKRLRSEPTMSP
jgi:ribonuclease III